MLEIEYKNINIGDLKFEISDSNNRRNRLQMLYGGNAIESIIVDGEHIEPTGRFFESLYSKFGINKSFFKYFDHTEVFKRIADKNNQNIRLCIEKIDGKKRLLAATGLNKPIIVYDDLMDIINPFNSDKINYSNGIVSSTHNPRNQCDFNIGGDKFSNKFVMCTPIDGYGQPNIFLSLLRYVCSNGAIGFANAFKTSLQLGSGSDSITYTLKRALETFSNDEGYSQLRDRFETAMKSWASIREQQELYKIILKLQNDDVLKQKANNIAGFKKDELDVSLANALMKSYGRVTGDPFELYKISDPNLMSQKKQRTLPVSCRVYDIINFATELASHHVSEYNSRYLQAWVGKMLSNDFDLEDSCDQFDDWRSLFLGGVNK